MIHQLVAAAALALVAGASGDTLIRHVGVVDVIAGAVAADRDVLIRDGRIAAIEIGGGVDADDGVTVVDGRGHYLMPGLFDAHVHLTAGMGTFERPLIAHGVTAVRDTGAATFVILNMRRQALEGATLSPELIVTGAIVDGNPPVWPFSEVCETADHAIAAVDRLVEQGVDQIKVYSRLPAEAYRAAVRRAHERGLKVTGHVPTAVSLRDAIAAGQDCIEHFEGFASLLLELLPPEEGANGEPQRQRGGFFASFRSWARFAEVDPQAIDEVLEALAERQIMQCPTTAVWRGLGHFADEDRLAAVREDRRIATVPEFLVNMWTQQGNPAFAEAIGRAMPGKRALLRRMHELGVPLMIGTDLGNPFVFPGSSVHEEMAFFVDAGIPVADVLRMATIAPARFCGVDDRLGSIEVGKTASLVLLSANPLESIDNARAIEAVFLRGTHHDRAALDAMLGLRPAEVPDAPSERQPDARLGDDLPGRLVARGTFELKFGPWPAGHEHFAMTRTDDGVHAIGHVAPSSGGPPGSITRIDTDGKGAIRTVTWRQLTDRPTEAEYRVDGSTLIARGRVGDGEWRETTIELPERWIFETGSSVTDMVTLPHLGLAVGDSVTLPTFSIGAGWEPQRMETTIERLDDEVVAVEDGTSVTRPRYRSVVTTPMGALRSTMWFDDDGTIVRYELEMPQGTLTAVRP